MGGGGSRPWSGAHTKYNPDCHLLNNLSVLSIVTPRGCAYRKKKTLAIAYFRRPECDRQLMFHKLS